jgi:hypothetical protein
MGGKQKKRWNERGKGKLLLKAIFQREPRDNLGLKLVEPHE